MRESRVPYLPSALSLGVILALGLLPVLHLAAQALAVAPGALPDAAWALDSHALRLLGRSTGIATLATLTSLGLGLCLGLPLARVRLRGRALVVAVLIAGLAVSPYQLGLGWLGGDLGTPTAGFLSGRPWIVAAVLGTAHAPLVALLVLFAARQLPAGWEEAALVGAPPWRVLTGIVLPHLLPALGLSAVLSFVLCFSDYAVASLFQVLTYPVDVFLFYAGAFDPVQAARACLPLLAVGSLCAVALAALLPRVVPTHGPPRIADTWPLPRVQERVGAGLVGATLLVCFAVPAAGLFSSLPVPVRGLVTLEQGGKAIFHSLAVTGTAAFLATVLGLAASGALGRLGARWRGLLTLLLFLPLCVPGSAYAIAWAELAFGTLTPLRAASAAFPPLLPALCLAGRWAGPAALLLAAARLSLPRTALEAARLQEGRPLRRLLTIELPWIAPLVVGVLVVVGAASLNAIGLLVLTIPPGFEVLPLRVDNLLHYGERGEAVALACVGALLAALPPLALLAVLDRRQRGRP